MDLGRIDRLASDAQEKATALYTAYPHENLRVNENLNDDVQPSRGEAWSVLVNGCSRPLLRFGFLLQAAALLIGLSIYGSFGGAGIFTFDLFSIPEEFRYNAQFSRWLIILESLSLIGVLCLVGFQVYTSDSSKSTRGFRAGSKMLSTAVTLDIFVVALRLMQYFYALNFLGNRWWLKYTQSSTDWCLFHATGLAHGLALALYGLGVFYLGAYHEQQVNEFWSWICFVLFEGASLTELLLVFTHVGTFGTIIQLLALLVAFLWSLQFEPLTHYRAAEFHDRDVNSGLANDD